MDDEFRENSSLRFRKGFPKNWRAETGLGTTYLTQYTGVSEFPLTFSLLNYKGRECQSTFFTLLSLPRTHTTTQVDWMSQTLTCGSYVPPLSPVTRQKDSDPTRNNKTTYWDPQVFSEDCYFESQDARTLLNRVRSFIWNGTDNHETSSSLIILINVSRKIFKSSYNDRDKVSTFSFEFL